MHILQLKPQEDRRLRTGHLWIFSNEIESCSDGFPDGGVGTVLDSRGHVLGQAYLNRHSLIAARMLLRGEGSVDDALLEVRLRDALALRARVLPDVRFGRMVFGESDLLPGLVLDRYGDVMVVAIGTLGMERLWPRLLPLVRKVFEPQVVVYRSESGARKLEGLEPHVGVEGDVAFDGRVEFEENGVRFQTDVLKGQKTGWFYDQRENRAALTPLVRDARVLDAFCYAGGWGVVAALGGAREVLGLDSSEFALELARANAALSGVQARCGFERADVFEALREMARGGRRFDVVVLDPPSLIKSRARIKEGMRGYHDLNRVAFSLVEPGGLLVSCSCSNLLPREEFTPMLSRAARDARVTGRVLEVRGASRDHPSLLAMRETDYLKCAYVEVLR